MQPFVIFLTQLHMWRWIMSRSGKSDKGVDIDTINEMISLRPVEPKETQDKYLSRIQQDFIRLIDSPCLLVVKGVLY